MSGKRKEGSAMGEIMQMVSLGIAAFTIGNKAKTENMRDQRMFTGNAEQRKKAMTGAYVKGADLLGGDGYLTEAQRRADWEIYGSRPENGYYVPTDL